MSRKAFLLRIDVKLWEELLRWSHDELRSANGQIEYLLKQAVDKRKGVRPSGDSLADRKPDDS